jgi:hypothetical protein
VKGLHGTSWESGEARSPHWRSGARATAPALLAPFSTSLPLGLFERLRVAARQLGLREREIAAEAIDLFLEREGF